MSKPLGEVMFDRHNLNMTRAIQESRTGDNLTGKTVTLRTARQNGIEPMVEVLADDGKWLRYRGLFGGTRVRRTRKSRVSKIL